MTITPTEHLVNTTVTGNQDWAQIAALSDGGWIVTWSSSQDGDPDSADIYQQRFDRNGQPIGGEVIVNTTTAGVQTRNFVTALGDGGWIVTWLDDGQFYQQRFASDGSMDGAATPITSGEEHFTNVVIELDDGGWLSVSGTFFSTMDVYLTRYDSSGVQVGGVELVSDSGWSMFPYATALPDGGWIVTWTQDLEDIWQIRYDADGNGSSAEKINTTAADSIGDSPVVTLADGGWLVAWQATDGDSEEIRFQRFMADGTRDGGETTVTTDGMFHDVAALQGLAVAALGDGGWIVTWVLGREDTVESGDGRVMFQRYDAAGTPVGCHVTVSSHETIETSYPSVTALSDGGWIISWTNTGADGDGDGIYQVRYTADGIPVKGVLPESANQVRTIDEDSLYAFESTDFSFTDSEIGTLDEIVIATVPDNGELLLGGVKIGNDTAIDADDLESLIWIPEADSFGENLGALTFKVRDSDGDFSLDTYSINIDVSDVVDIFKGTKGKDKLIGTDGHDILRGRKGNDVMTGNGGSDHFVIEKRSGKDRITDFDAFGDGDVLDLAKVDSVKNWRDLKKNHLDERGDDVIIDFGGGNRVVLKNVDFDDLDKTDFFF